MELIQVVIWCVSLAAAQGSVSTNKAVNLQAEQEQFLLREYQIPVRVVSNFNVSNSNARDIIRYLSCPLFEEYLECGPTCQITCGSLGQSCPPGPCRRGCFCELGKVRSRKTGKCISQKHCTSKWTNLNNKLSYVYLDQDRIEHETLSPFWSR